MCDFGAAIGGAISIGTSLLSYNAQKAQSAKDNAYNLQVQATQEAYRADLLKYGNTVYEQEIDYGNEVLSYQKAEFGRQVDLVEKAQAGIEKNYLAKVGTLLQRRVEETMAFALGVNDVADEGRKQRSTIAAKSADRGLEGVSVEAVLGDISRQEGEAITSLTMTEEAKQRQFIVDGASLKAEADSQRLNTVVRTYNPTAPVQAPSPVNPVTPAAQRSDPSVGTLIAGIGAGVGNSVASAAKSGSLDRAFSSFRSALKI